MKETFMMKMMWKWNHINKMSYERSNCLTVYSNSRPYDSPSRKLWRKFWVISNATRFGKSKMVEGHISCWISGFLKRMCSSPQLPKTSLIPLFVVVCTNFWGKSRPKLCRIIYRLILCNMWMLWPLMMLTVLMQWDREAVILTNLPIIVLIGYTMGISMP